MDVSGILAAIESHALALGQFERVNLHEPKSAPGNGLTCAIWADEIRSIKGSGLASTSVLLTFNIRLYTNMVSEPQDAIDPAMLTAVDVLLAAFTGDFDLDIDEVRNIDLLGQYGSGLMAKAGYLNQDNKVYRLMTISLPIIVNDIWTQNA